ncbi:MAG: T9SS type A sorting domain-containing protein [Bacteroidetes bacterium]|nr:T9SS type A sorting domain-containing protein [Bacteroidota bacterium]
MKRYFTIIVTFIIAFSGFSQSIFRPALAYNEHFCSEPEIVVYSTFINKFTSSKLRFVRISNILTSTWTSAYCDCELCRDVKTDTADFILPVGDSCTTSMHFYPANKKGLGSVQIKIFDTANASVFVIGEYRASCWGLSSSFMDMNDIKIYPNPSNSSLTVSFGSIEPYTLNVVTADGKLLMKTKVEGLNHKIDISSFAPGLYSIKIESGGKLFFTRFIKI